MNTTLCVVWSPTRNNTQFISVLHGFWCETVVRESSLSRVIPCIFPCGMAEAKQHLWKYQFDIINDYSDWFTFKWNINGTSATWENVYRETHAELSARCFFRRWLIQCKILYGEFIWISKQEMGKKWTWIVFIDKSQTHKKLTDEKKIFANREALVIDTQASGEAALTRMTV